MPYGYKGRGKRAQTGVGLQVTQLPEDIPVPFATFKGGYFASDSEGDAPEGFSPDCLDVYVDNKDRLLRMPGLVLIENVSPRDPFGMFSHASLDRTTEIVMFDSPYMGTKEGDDATVWSSVALPIGDNWVATNHGGVLVFSNGVTAVYSRESGAIVVTDLLWPGPVRALVSFAGRVFGGGIDDGVYNPMGMYWTGASGLESDVGAGSGFELLLADVAEGDNIVSLRAMGDDLMVILCRKSLWIGVRTGDPYRPADFRPKTVGKGCVSDPTVRVTPNGTIYLSDDGVEVFDGNSSVHLSSLIDNEIIPLDYSQINRYGALFSPITQEYILLTPDRMWRYSLERKNWFPSSARVHRGITLFNPAVVGSGAGLPAGWDLYWDGSWSEVLDTDNTVLSDLVLLSDTSLVKEDNTIETYLGAAQNPYWWTPRIDFDGIESVFTVKKFQFDYADDGNISIYYKDDTGVTRLYATLDLVKFLKFTKTFSPTQFQLVLNDGKPKLKKITVTGIPRSTNIKLDSGT